MTTKNLYTLEQACALLTILSGIAFVALMPFSLLLSAVALLILVLSFMAGKDVADERAKREEAAEKLNLKIR